MQIYATDKDDNSIGWDVKKLLTIQQDEATQNKPVVSDLQENYVLTIGETLTLDGMITAVGDGKLTAVNLKHNEADTAFADRRFEVDTTTFSLADFGIFTTEEYPLNEVGTYEFCIYAAATNYTVTDNLIAKISVTVVEKVCNHVNASDS